MIERTSRLLLVACSENFCKTLGRILKRAGYEVDCAGSGDEALIRLAWNPYDAIISEVHLPGEMCGISLMQQVRAAGHDAPVIVLAEGETARIRAALASCPGAACLQMPLDVDELKEIVANRCASVRADEAAATGLSKVAGSRC
jgi:DNA-binding NtrC family response regulator